MNISGWIQLVLFVIALVGLHFVIELESLAGERPLLPVPTIGTEHPADIEEDVADVQGRHQSGRYGRRTVTRVVSEGGVTGDR